MAKKEPLKKIGNKQLAIDIQIAAGMTVVGLLNAQGMQAIQQVIKGANDAAAAIAHVIYMAVAKVRSELQKRKIDIDDRVWIMGGGVLDRVMFEIMSAIAMALQYPQAKDPKFVAQVKSDILDLMEDDDQNAKAIKVLHDKGLPVPKGPPGQSGGMAQPQPQQQQQAGPQGPPQQGGMNGG